MLVVRSRQRVLTVLLIVVEVAVEHDVAIPLALLMMIVNQRNSMEVHLGYNMDGSNDAGMLVFSVVTFLILKILSLSCRHRVLQNA